MLRISTVRIKISRCRAGLPHKHGDLSLGPRSHLRTVGYGGMLSWFTQQLSGLIGVFQVKESCLKNVNSFLRITPRL